MQKRQFLRLVSTFALGAWFAPSSVFAVESEAFPLRKIFPEVKTIDIAKLSARLDLYNVVDVRSPFEFDIIRIKGAVNIPVAQSDFVQLVKSASKASSKPIVFYCNGHHCDSAYTAAQKAMQQGKITDVMNFDGGIFSWARAQPQLTLLLDKPLDPKNVISDEKFAARTLAPQEFIKQANTNPSVKIIDLRDRFQVAGVSLFPSREVRTGSDMTSIKKAITEAQAANQPIYFYDASGHRVRTLQYLLQDMNVSNYFFMLDGMVGYYASIGKMS